MNCSVGSVGRCFAWLTDYSSGLVGVAGCGQCCYGNSVDCKDFQTFHLSVIPLLETYLQHKIENSIKKKYRDSKFLQF